MFFLRVTRVQQTWMWLKVLSRTRCSALSRPWSSVSGLVHRVLRWGVFTAFYHPCVFWNKCMTKLVVAWFMVLKSIFSLCCQASVDHLSTGLKSATQTALARRLLLRQLRATLCKGQVVFLQPWFIAVRFPADSWRLALCFAGQWSRPGEVCCVLSLDQPSTERITCFLPVPSDSSAPLEWNEEISL